MTDKKRRPTRRRLQSELDDLRERAGGDDDITVTINHVAVPPVDDDADEDDDAMVLHRRWSTDEDADGFDVDPDDVRAAAAGDDDATERLDAAGYGTPEPVGGDGGDE